MKRYNIALGSIILAMIAITSTVDAIDAISTFTASAQEKIDITEQELQKKIVEHAVEGNLTMEHISLDVKVKIEEMKEEFKEELKEQGREYVDQNLNLTEEELQQKLKEEVQNQPGFGCIISIAGLLAAIYLQRR